MTPPLGLLSRLRGTASAPESSPLDNIPALKGCVIVTGGARGIGREITSAFLQAGHRVVVMDLALTPEFPAMALSTGQTTADAAPQLVGYELDLADEVAVDSAVGDVLCRFRRIDTVVCNAGGGSGPVSGSRASDVVSGSFHEMMQRNLFTAVNVCGAALPSMKRQRSGSIITVASINGLRPTAVGNYAHYGVAKAALIHYTRYLARDIGSYGITANSLAPGTVATERLERLYQDEGRTLSGAEAANGNVASPRDIADAVVFLSGAPHITGQVLSIDGGIAIG